MWNDGGGQYGGTGGYQSMDSSSTRFGEGGFMQDNQFSSPTTASQEKKKSNKAQSVIPCTVKQLNSAVCQPSGDTFSLGDIDLVQVSFIGVIRSFQVSSTNVVYHINDMTSEDIVVKKWMNESEESTEEKERREACKENNYVHVTGNLKTFQDNSRCVVAFSILPVEDFNQISLHMLEVVHAHLTLQKHPDVCSGIPATAAMTPGRGTYQGGNMAGTPRTMNTSYGGGGGGNNSGLSGVEKQVHEMISSCPGEEGMSLSTLRQRLKAVSENQIGSAIEFLSNEGHIYSTIDDEHFKSTDSA